MLGTENTARNKTDSANDLTKLTGWEWLLRSLLILLFESFMVLVLPITLSINGFCKRATMPIKIIQYSSLAGKPNKGKVFIKASKTYIPVVVFAFSSRAHCPRRPSSWWYSLPNPCLSPQRKAKVSSCLWGVGNDRQEKIKHGGGMVGVSKKAIPETQQPGQDKGHSPSCKWSSSCSQMSPC